MIKNPKAAKMILSELDPSRNSDEIFTAPRDWFEISNKIN